jgi:hypothetical protein
MDNGVAQIVVKGALSLLCVWGGYHLWRLWPGRNRTGVRLVWFLAAVLTAGALAALWRWNLDRSDLLSQPARLLRSVGKRLSSMGSRDPDGLYQHGEFAALGEGSTIDTVGGRVTFKALSHANLLLFSREIEYRSWRLRCPFFGGASDVPMSGKTMRVYTDVRCEILGKRSVP